VYTEGQTDHEGDGHCLSVVLGQTDALAVANTGVCSHESALRAYRKPLKIESGDGHFTIVRLALFRGCCNSLVGAVLFLKCYL